MSGRGQVDVLEIVSRYAAGYFPLYDVEGRFYWERLGVRAVVPVNAVAAGRARRMVRNKARFEMRYTTAVAEVIRHLRDAGEGGVKSNSWVRGEVIRIYEALHEAGLLQTVEAWEVKAGGSAGGAEGGKGGRLVGGLLGIVMPGTFIAETMFGLVPEASKACLCRLVEDCWNGGVVEGGGGGFEMIDVQTPHNLDEFGRLERVAGRTAHPCIRLGEESVTLAVFKAAFQGAWKRGFPGGVREWVAAAGAVRQGGRGGAGRAVEGVSVVGLERARGYLRRTGRENDEC